MSDKQKQPKASKNGSQTAWAVVRLMAVTGFAVAGMVLLDWIIIPDQARDVIGAFLLATAVTLTFLWFRYTKIRV